MYIRFGPKRSAEANPPLPPVPDGFRRNGLSGIKAATRSWESHETARGLRSAHEEIGRETSVS
jgi:hypothetical protein